MIKPLPGATTDEQEQTSPGAATAPAPGSTDATAGPIEDKKLDQFADAYLAVQTIQQKAATELQSAKDPQAADKVKATAESDMIAAVERSGPAGAGVQQDRRAHGIGYRNALARRREAAGT